MAPRFRHAVKEMRALDMSRHPHAPGGAELSQHARSAASRASLASSTLCGALSPSRRAALVRVRESRLRRRARAPAKGRDQSKTSTVSMLNPPWRIDPRPDHGAVLARVWRPRSDGRHTAHHDPDRVHHLEL